MRKPSSSQRKGRGSALLPMALSLTGVLGVAGLAVDTVRAYFVRAALAGAIDGAVMAAARVPEAQMERVADSVFRVNFPEGLMTSRTRSHEPLKYNPATHVISLSGHASMDTFFMKVLGQNELSVTAVAAAERPRAAADGDSDSFAVVVMDRTAISSTAEAVVALCGEHAAVCVNEDIAAPGLRRLLFDRPSPMARTSELRLRTGDEGNEGLFRFLNPETQSNLRDGAAFSVSDFVFSAGLAGSAAHLDQVADVAALRAPEIKALQGQTVCAVALRDEVRPDPEDHSAALGGEALGLTAFRVSAVEDTGPGATRLPDITVALLPAEQVSVACAQASRPDAGGERIPVLVR